MTNELSTQGLLAQAAKLNKLSEVSQVALGMCLVKIKETEAYKGEYDSFDEYYKSELKRSKGDISKLLKVGRFMLDGGFRTEKLPEVGYTVLYSAILSYPEKDPKYVLAAAQTQTLAELADGSRDKFGIHTPDWEPAYHCKVCGKYTLNKDNHD